MEGGRGRAGEKREEAGKKVRGARERGMEGEGREREYWRGGNEVESGEGRGEEREGGPESGEGMKRQIEGEER